MLAHVDNRITYNGNGNATEFAYQFKILDRTDIKVLLTDADGKEKLLTKDYYVDVEKNVVRYPGYAVGAEVPESERPPVLPTGWKLTIYREVPVTQETDLPDQYPFNQVEDIGDKLTMIAQQLTDVTSRSLKISVSKSADIDATIPFDAGKSFRIADDGKRIVLTEDPANVLPLAQSKLEATTAQANIAAAKAAAAAESESKAESYAANADASKTAAVAKVIEATDEANRAKAEADRAKSISDNIGNPVSDVTENNGTVTVTKSNGTQSTFMAFPQDANGTLPIAKGGTGASTASQACANIGALPTSGGTITGSIVAGASMSVIKGDKTKNIIITSGTDYDDSPSLMLYPSESTATELQGQFRLQAKKDDVTKQLIGKPNGELVWGGQQIYRKQAESFGANSGYIKFHDNTIIQYGHTVLGTSIEAGAKTVVTLPAAFSSTNYRVVASDGGGGVSIAGAQIKSNTQIYLIKNINASAGVSWIAFGK